MSYKKQFGSDNWIPGIKNLCFDYLKNLQKRPGGSFLKFKDYLGTIDKPGKLVKEYHRSALSLKHEIFGKDTSHSFIDYHKIASLYIRSFLKYKPFFLDIPKETKEPNLCLYTMLPNEYFVLPFLEAVFRAGKEDYNGLLIIDNQYKDDLIKLLYHYGKNISLLDALSFSNTIFLIEQQYFFCTDKK